MTIRAEFSKKYLLRYLIISVLAIGWAAYCAYDAFIMAPGKLKYSEAYFGIVADDDDDRAKKWKKITEEKGWKYVSGKYPKKEPKKLRAFILWNYGMGVAALLIGLPNLFLLLANRNAWIEMEGDQITTSWKQSLATSDITAVDKVRWERKGICKIDYEVSGRKQFFMLDDFKFDRDEVGKILRNIEDSIDTSMISGGRLESELESAAAIDSESESQSE